VTIRGRTALLVGGALALLCLSTPKPAGAITIQPSKTKARVTQTKAAMRKAPKPPKRDQVHRGGVDGAITLIQFISTRRQHDEDQAVPHGSVAQVRASSDDAEPRSPTTLTARAVESLPPHWGSTHLCI
jgi:hypothetical protein